MGVVSWETEVSSLVPAAKLFKATVLDVGQLHTVNRDYINYINITHHVR